MTVCGILPPSWEQSFKDGTECPLPFGHDGAHQSTVPHYGTITWETDFECQCNDCLSDEPGNWCVAWGPIAPTPTKDSSHAPLTPEKPHV